MRSLLVTVLGALLIGGAVTTSAWALQAALLPPPEHGDLSALAAVTALERFRFVESSVSVDGARSADPPTSSGTCAAAHWSTVSEDLRVAVIVPDAWKRGTSASQPSGRSPATIRLNSAATSACSSV